MVSFVDEAVGNLTRALKETHMWDSTLFVWTTGVVRPLSPCGRHPLWCCEGGWGDPFVGL